MASTEIASDTQQENIFRPIADFPENIWAHHFPSFTLDEQVCETHVQEIEMLKEQVRSMLVTTGNSLLEKLNVIDVVERLGISYHFEKEIEQQLEEAFNLYANIQEYPTCDLSTVAIHFRLLRQHGFNISCGVFHQFMNANGKFKESLSSDIRGLLNLYEAACVRTHNDTILEEALSFATTHLTCLAPDAGSTIAKQVEYALKQPLHRGVPRYEARRYISIYDEDESKNHTLLRLAKLDFNQLQMLHKQELSEISRWSNELHIESRIPYTRNRFVECYFWALGVFHEPQYSIGRILFAKTIISVSIHDDIYDAYGTLCELKIYTNAIERWDASEIDGLPDYMLTSLKELFKLHEDLSQELAQKQRSSAYCNYRQLWQQYARACYREAKWLLTNEEPSFDDYLATGVITSTYFVLAAAAFLGMDSATNDVFEWLSNNPKIVVGSCKVVRLLNDVCSFEYEKKRNIGTAIEYYMKDYGTSEQEAIKRFEDMVEDAWKDVNEDCLKPTTMAREILMRVLNLARLASITYGNREDRYTHPHILEPYIIAVLVDSTNV